MSATTTPPSSIQVSEYDSNDNLSITALQFYTQQIIYLSGSYIFAFISTYRKITVANSYYTEEANLVCHQPLQLSTCYNSALVTTKYSVHTCSSEKTTSTLKVNFYEYFHSPVQTGLSSVQSKHRQLWSKSAAISSYFTTYLKLKRQKRR